MEKTHHIIGLLIAPLLLLTPILGFSYQNEINEFADFVHKNMDKIASRRKVAVTDILYDKGVFGKLGQFLADELSVSLTNRSGNYEVLNRNQLKTIVDKTEFGLKQPYNEKDVKDLGNKLKVGGIVAGTISVYKNYIKVSIDLISTYSGKVVATKSINIPNTQKIKDLIKEDLQDESEEFLAKGEYLDFIEYDGIRFEFKHCKQLDVATMCSFTVTSKKDETWRFYLNNASSLYDEQGINYRIYEMGLGGRTGQSNYYVYTDLIPKVPENGVIYFEKVPDRVKSVDLTIVLNDERNQVYKASFKGVLLKK